MLVGEDFVEVKGEGLTCELSSRRMNTEYQLSLLFMVFLAYTLIMSNNFSKEDRMDSDWEVGS